MAGISIVVLTALVVLNASVGTWFNSAAAGVCCATAAFCAWLAGRRRGM